MRHQVSEQLRLIPFCYFYDQFVYQVGIPNWRTNLFGSISLILCIVRVQTIASSFEALSLSRSRCFRFRLVTPSGFQVNQRRFKDPILNLGSWFCNVTCSFNRIYVMPLQNTYGTFQLIIMLQSIGALNRKNPFEHQYLLMSKFEEEELPRYSPKAPER